MTQEEETLLIIRGSIAELPLEQQKEIIDFYNEITAKVQSNPILGMAIAWLGAKMATL